MAETILIILGICYLIYRVAFGVPKDIKKLEDKVDMLKLHLQENELRLIQLDKKLEDKVDMLKLHLQEIELRLIQLDNKLVKK